MENIVLPEDQRWCIGFEGKYAASYDGEIWSYCNKEPIKIVGAVLHDKKRGYITYRTFSLKEEGKQKCKYFHRMIAEAWIPNPDGKPQVNHRDHDKLNNCVDNLEWTTAKDNVRAMYEHHGKDNIANTRVKNKGFENESDFIKFIHSGELKGYKGIKILSSKIDQHVWEVAGVPKEITDIVIRNGCYLDNWNYIITLLDEVFDYGNKLITLEYMFDINMTLPSHIRAGRRWTKEVELYNKYRYDPVYTKFYKKTFSVK